MGLVDGLGVIFQSWRQHNVKVDVNDRSEFVSPFPN